MKLSIVTINLNHAAGLKRTVESVRAQDFRDYEFIVIDGGSTDGSLDLIRANAGQIACWVSEPDRGIFHAMNKGLRLAHGEYVYFLNSGDWLVSSTVLSRVFAGNAGDEDLLYGSTLRPDGTKGFREPPEPELTIACFFGAGICHQGIFYKRRLFDALGAYDDTLKIVGDWDFNIRALLAGCSTRRLPFPIAHYDGLGISATRRDLSEREKAGILKRHLPDAVYRDYGRLKSLEAECCRLKKFEDWAEQIRHRNVLVNIAMAGHWFWLGIKQKLSRRTEGER